MDATDRRVVLLGKSGTGKSSLANTIFGVEDLFKVSHRSNSEKNPCEAKTRKINEKNIQLIDTPGLFDTNPKSTELSPELLKCLTECAPGPHAFLIVLKVEKFTPQEQAVVDIILKYFSEEALKYATVVFTHGDQLEKGMKIEDWSSNNDALRTLIQKCGGRCHVFDSKHWNDSQDEYRNNQEQVRELLKTIDQTVEKNRGGYYTNEMLQMIGSEIQEEVTCLQTSCPGITFNDLVHKAKMVIYSKLMNNMEGAVVGVLLGAFLGAGGGVMVAIAVSPTLLPSVCAAVTGAAVGGPTGMLVGAWASEHWRTPTEAVRDATDFLSELEPLAHQANTTWNVLTAGRALTTAASD